MQPVDRPLLMWVTDRRRSDAALPELASQISAAGADLVQVRERGLDRLPLELLVRAIQAVVTPTTKLVLNGDIELAAKLHIGVHLQESGASVEQARAQLGASALIGRSVHSVAAAEASRGVDYLVAGHVFETRSKVGIAPLGLDRLALIVEASSAPVLAIGGITPDRVGSVLQAGATGVAVMGPLTLIESALEMTTRYREELDRSMTDHNPHDIVATINGKHTQVPPGTTVADFLAGRELHERLVVVERNGEILKRSTFGEVLIENGDILEIVHFVGGG